MPQLSIVVWGAPHTVWVVERWALYNYSLGRDILLYSHMLVEPNQKSSREAKPTNLVLVVDVETSMILSKQIKWEMRVYYVRKSSRRGEIDTQVSDVSELYMVYY